jgi:hypothetical protein
MILCLDTKKFMAREHYQSLLRSGLSQAEIKILSYLNDLCIDWGFTTETSLSVANFFEINHDNVRKRIANMKKLDIIKVVEYNGRSGLMVNPIYCYQGKKRVIEFREKLWAEEKIYTRFKPRYFYGPPLVSEKELQENAIFRPRISSRSYRVRTKRIYNANRFHASLKNNSEP